MTKKGDITIKNLSKLETQTYWNFNVTTLNGNLILRKLDVEFAGSKNMSLLVHTITTPVWSANLTLQMYYSKFNASVALGKSAYNVFPTSKDSKNVTPFGQNNLTPAWNITNLAYDLPLDVYVRFNGTLNCTTGNLGGVNVTYSNSSSKEDGFFVNTSFQPILINISKEKYQRLQSNQTVNITMNGTGNSTLLRVDIVDEQFGVKNASEPYPLLNRNSDYKINFTTGNITLLNSTFNITNLLATYNFSLSTPWKGIWNWWDLSNCTKRFLQYPFVEFQTYCQGCVR